MKILLDTHAFIWFAEDDNQLENTIKRTIEKSTNNIYVSIASIWEMAIKMQLNKLKLEKKIREIVDLLPLNGFEFLPILPEHIIKMNALEFHHRDPFDRIIIAQGLNENFKVISKDTVFDKYGVDRLWKWVFIRISVKLCAFFVNLSGVTKLSQKNYYSELLRESQSCRKV